MSEASRHPADPPPLEEWMRMSDAELEAWQARADRAPLPGEHDWTIFVRDCDCSGEAPRRPALGAGDLWLLACAYLGAPLAWHPLRAAARGLRWVGGRSILWWFTAGSLALLAAGFLMLALGRNV